MKVVVDYDVCASNAVCMGIAPEVFEVRDDGYLYVLNENPPAELMGQGAAWPPTTARRGRSRSSRTSSARGGSAPAGPAARAPGPLRPVAHGVPPRRQRPDRALQLALRPPHRRHLRPAHRGHRHRAQPRGVGRRHPVVAVVAGHGARRGPVPPVRRAPTPTGPAIDLLWDAGALYACDCTREEIDARTKGNATPGYDGFCRDRGLERDGPGPALPGPRRRGRRSSTTSSGATSSFAHDGHRGLRGREVVGSAAVRPRQRGRRRRHAHHPRHPGRGPACRRRPRGCSCGPRSRAPRPRCPSSPTCPLLVNEQRQKLSKRTDDVAVESYRERGLPGRRPCATTWRCWAGATPRAARSSPSRSSWRASTSRT